MFITLQEGIVQQFNDTDWTHSPEIYVELPQEPNFPYVTIDSMSDQSTYTDSEIVREVAVVFAVVDRWQIGKIQDRALKRTILEVEESFDTKIELGGDRYVTSKDFHISSRLNRQNSNIIETINEDQGLITKRGTVGYEYIIQRALDNNGTSYLETSDGDILQKS